jgi:AsmA protein
MKTIIRWLAIAAGVLLLALVTLPLWLNANQFRPLLESDLSEALGREVKVGDLKLALLSGSVTTNDLSVADDPVFNRTPFVQAKSLHLAIELWPLISSRKLIVTGLTIVQPEITLLQSPAGEWNFSKLGAKTAAKPAKPAAEKGGLDLSVKLVKITGGRFTLGKTGGRAKPLVLDHLNAELRDFSNTTVFPFSLDTKVAGGGSIKLEGKAGPIHEADVAGTPVDAALKIVDLDLAGSGFVAESPVDGLFSFEGNGTSRGEDVEAHGSAWLEKLRLAKTGTPARNRLELVFVVHHNTRKHSGQVSRGDIHIGKAVASVTGTYAAQGESTVLRMNLSGPDMPVSELAAFLPAMGIVLPAGSSLQGGTANAKFTMEGPTDRLVTSGSLAFQNTKLAGFDMGKKMETIERLSGIRATPDTEIQTLSANLRMGPEGISAENMTLIVPAIGQMGGGGTISPANALEFKLTAAVHGGGMIAMVSDKPVPFLVGGTCSQPVFRPDMRAVAQQQVERLKGEAGKAAGSFLKGILGGKKN